MFYSQGMFQNCLYICYCCSAGSSSGKEDTAFAKERDAQRKKFDKKTGKAVTVTGPKDKPESVCIYISY